MKSKKPSPAKWSGWIAFSIQGRYQRWAAFSNDTAVLVCNSFGWVVLRSDRQGRRWGRSKLVGDCFDTAAAAKAYAEKEFFHGAGT